MTEIWKSLNGIVKNGHNYEVSNFGNVRSIDRIDSRGNKRKGKIIAKSVHNDGYVLVGLSSDGKQIRYLLHRLVALAFIPNPENKQEVNHKDGDKSNCIVDNLEWSTRNENVQHAYDEKLINKKDVGENHYLAKLNDKSVKDIRRLYATGEYSQKELGKIYGVRQDVISDVVRFKTWKHVK